MISYVGAFGTNYPTNRRNIRDTFDIELPYYCAPVDLPNTHDDYDRDFGESLAFRTASNGFGTGKSASGYRQSDVLRWCHDSWGSNDRPPWPRRAFYHPAGIRCTHAEGPV